MLRKASKHLKDNFLSFYYDCRVWSTRQASGIGIGSGVLQMRRKKGGNMETTISANLLYGLFLYLHSEIEANRSLGLLARKEFESFFFAFGVHFHLGPVCLH